MTHERRPIEAIDDDLDFLGVEVWRFAVQFGTVGLVASVLVYIGTWALEKCI